VGLAREEMRSREGEAYAKIVEFARPGDRPLHIGWLVVPGFYGDDLNPPESRSSSVSNDVRVLLRRMMTEKVDGVALDLRGNLGGLLDEAIELGGLFCGQVPIAAVRSPEVELEILEPARMKTKKGLYEGPLVVLTDRGSASASELVAGALQDHGRAVVVGGEQTFGKGSVQTTVALNDYFKTKSKLPVGGLDLTVGKFYRVNGQSTQLTGVHPDIILPSTLDVPREGEGALVNPLAQDSIEPVVQNAGGLVSLETLDRLKMLSAQRVNDSPQFAAIIAERDQIRNERRENRLSLEEKKRKDALDLSQKSYAEREATLERTPFGARFARLLLEDTKARKLKFENTDPLGGHDPESVVIERETMQVLLDLIEKEPHP
jgi:carboxyl-terminal processing protease